MKKRHLTLPRAKIKYARYRLHTGYSGIHRFGVYALENIPARRIVIEYTGKRLGDGKLARLPFTKTVYVAGLTECVSIGGREGGSGAEFVNHSCVPNLEMKRAEGRLFLASRRKIRAGEELTLHNHYPAKLSRVPCNCGDRNCRKTFQLPLDPF